MNDNLDIAAIRASFLDKYAINSNLIDASKFIFISHNMPNLNMFCQSIMMPSVSVGEALQPTPFVDLYRAGDKLQYEPISVTFLIDEDMKVWEELYNWIVGMSFPHNRGEYTKQKRAGIYADVSLLFLKNSFETNLAIRLENCWPTYVGPVQFSSTEDSETVMTTDVTFRFDTFNVYRGSI